jgi:hypothetical protein
VGVCLNPYKPSALVCPFGGNESFPQQTMLRHLAHRRTASAWSGGHRLLEQL